MSRSLFATALAAPAANAFTAAAAAVRHASALDLTWLRHLSDQHQGHGRRPWPFL